MRVKFHFPPSREGGCPSCSAPGYSNRVPFQQAGLQKEQKLCYLQTDTASFSTFHSEIISDPGNVVQTAQRTPSPPWLPQTRTSGNEERRVGNAAKGTAGLSGFQLSFQVCWGLPRLSSTGSESRRHTQPAARLWGTGLGQRLSRWEEEHFDLLPSHE